MCMIRSMAKPGPKTDPLLGELKQRTLMLDDLTFEQLRVVGAGNASRGARLAARREYGRYQATPDEPQPIGAPS